VSVKVGVISPCQVYLYAQRERESERRPGASEWVRNNQQDCLAERERISTGGL